MTDPLKESYIIPEYTHNDVYDAQGRLLNVMAIIFQAAHRHSLTNAETIAVLEASLKVMAP